jgi:carbamoyltransferase
LYSRESRVAKELRAQLRQKLARGETAWLVGLGVHGHNAGAALVEVSPRTGLRLISNDEEERFLGIKHFSGYPEQAVQTLGRRLDQLGLTGDDVSAFVTSWDYSRMGPLGVRALFEHFPASLGLARRGATPKFNVLGAVRAAGRAPGRLAQQLGMRSPPNLVMLPHHDNHAAFSFATSPFRHSDRPVMVTVLDGFGDEGSISLYVGQHGRMQRVYQNDSIFDSLGLFYSVLSSTQGGWTTLSSEGRYMGAVAWGDQDRLTNPYYRRLRQIFHFGAAGQVHVNRDYANWFCQGELQPYKRALTDIVGEPIAPERMWNPDAILRVEDVEHSPVTRDRVDVAAATQLVFEDVLFHVVDHLIRSTRSDQLVLTGGTALNCLANMRLLERFDRDWYRRNLQQETELNIWVPPTPGDAGVTIGAAYQFALDCGVPPGEPLQHAFYCGLPPTTDEIADALETTPEIAFQSLGSIATSEGLRDVADFMAYVVARDGVLGIFQSSAETGPRALGHRSILANPCNPNTLENINARVKFREPIRPLAPMATLEAAHRYFHLAPGARADDFAAYNSMVLTVEARPEAYVAIPAVVHRDGTARVQIVRRDVDPLMHAYLQAMGRHRGVEISVNTSLNVGTPIVQSPAQALDALKRAKALSGLVLVSEEGEAFLAWHDVTVSPKDGGQQLLGWLRDWQHDAAQSASLPSNAQSLP